MASLRLGNGEVVPYNEGNSTNWGQIGGEITDQTDLVEAFSYKQNTLVSGTNIKTINNQTILGSGNIDIQGGGTFPKIVMPSTTTTATLQPNTFYEWSEVASLNLSLATETSGVENKYLFQFQSGNVATTLVLPNTISWYGEQPTSLNTIYIVSVQSNIAKIERSYRESILPSNYQQVEYLQSSGTQTIDTGELITDNSILLIDMQYVNFTGPETYVIPFGSFQGGASPSLYTIKTSESNSYAYIEIGNTYGTSALPQIPVNLDKFNLRILVKSGTRSVFKDGVYVGGIQYNPQYLSTSNMMIFSSSANGAPNSFSNAKFYGWKHIVNDEVKAYLVPCYRKSDNVAGMYDVAKATFITNSGTGTFIVGPDI